MRLERGDLVYHRRLKLVGFVVAVASDNSVRVINSTYPRGVVWARDNIEIAHTISKSIADDILAENERLRKRVLDLASRCDNLQRAVNAYYEEEPDNGKSE